MQVSHATSVRDMCEAHKWAWGVLAPKLDRATIQRLQACHTDGLAWQVCSFHVRWTVLRSLTCTDWQTTNEVANECLKDDSWHEFY